MKKFLITFLVLIVLAGTAVAGFFYLIGPVSNDTAVIKFKIRPGMTVTAVAKGLADQNLIRHELAFRLYTKMSGTENSVKSGTYFLKKSMSLPEIHNALLKGSSELVKVTIPEGYSTSAIAAVLEKAGIGKAADFVKSAKESRILSQYGIDKKGAEGFLFPDTYYLDESMTSDNIIEYMVEVFFEKTADVIPKEIQDDKQALFDLVTLASIVEREYRVAQEAPLIASVFKNRLKIGMGLNSCATIEYIITEELGLPHPSSLKYTDLKLESDYNTYLWAGLPPGPISSPGLLALQAVLTAPVTDYMYFVLKDSAQGRHEFTTSLDAHNEAKSLYLKEKL